MTATTDLFSQVKFNDGEVLKYQDFDNQQSRLMSRITDQILKFLVSHSSGMAALPFDPDYTGDNPDDPSIYVPYAMTVHPGSAYLRKGSGNTKIQIAAGTLMQKVATVDGATPSILMYTFDGTGDQFTIANGDATNPRVDLLQMKLELVDGDDETVAFLQDGVKASIDMAAHTTHWDTKLRAKVAGISGNNVSISSAKRTSGSGVTYSENGNAALVQYEDAVSTVADIEAAIIANATIVEIEATGTAGNVMHHPADTVGYTHLSGGADQLLIDESLPKKKQVQCTLSVKQGAPAASPQYPDPDPDYVAVGGVVVGATWAGGSAPKFEDTAGANIVVHDQRMPIGLRMDNVMVDSYFRDSAHWTGTPTTNNLILTADNSAPGIGAVSPMGGSTGRVIGVANLNKDVAAFDFHLAKLFLRDSGAGAISWNATYLNVGFGLNGGTAARWHRRLCVMVDFETSHAPAAGPTVQGSGDKSIGVPVWTNGKRAPDQPFGTTKDLATAGFEAVCLVNFATPNTNGIGPTTFYIAGGL